MLELIGDDFAREMELMRHGVPLFILQRHLALINTAKGTSKWATENRSNSNIPRPNEAAAYLERNSLRQAKELLVFSNGSLLDTQVAESLQRELNRRPNEYLNAAICLD